jgi:solute:Na+ symporter, SSS family
MVAQFTPLDWSIVAGYLALLAITGVIFARHEARTANDYFLAGRSTSPWLVAASVLATTQSAATFLGGPDYGYRGDYTYLSTFLGALLAAAFVTQVLIPRFYALNATTVYELLAARFDTRAMRAAGAMYLVGRVFAGGARLYLAAIAVSMMLFSTVSAEGILWSSLALMIAGFLFTFFGGLRSIIWSDLLQFLIYVLAALFVLVYLWNLIPASGSEIVHALANTPTGENKLRFFDWTLDWREPFSVFAVFTGMFLIYAANFGLDQDTTQRLLACRNAKEGGRALYISAIAAFPVIFVFVTIGLLLYIFYNRPDLMQASGGTTLANTFEGESITVFMHFILTQIPPGLRGLVTVGVIAAAVSTINSGLNSMASVLIQDFYRPWGTRRGARPEKHFVNAGRIGMGLVGVALFAMSVVCYFWQRYTALPLLEFALSVMTFAYAGLLGVYFAAVFTRRGTSNSVVAALIVGFLAILFMQGYVVEALALPAGWKQLAFPWQLCIGTVAAFVTCIAVTQRVAPNKET